jgi:alpha-galactosidase
MAIKIAFIGAGSLGFTRKLVRDLLKVEELTDTHFAFHDIDRGNLDRVTQVCQKDIEANGVPARITATEDRREAVEGAKYVINCTRIGGLEAFEKDIDIPLKYGIDQCVGDTLCAGGIMYGQRNVPQILAFQKDMAELAADGCLFLNYANPMAINTWASLDAHDRGEGVHTVGLCHGVEGGWSQIAHALAHKEYGDELPEDFKANWKRYCSIICAGINHQTWYIQVLYKGREIGAEELIDAFESHPKFSQSEKVRIDVLKRFGCYSTESNGHLSEYLPWYRKRAEEIPRWIDDNAWIHGETGGYLRVCREGQNWFVEDFPRWLEEAGGSLADYKRSHEHGSYIIEAIETGRPYRGHFNVRNGGVIRNLPADCVIEAPGYVDEFGINMTDGLELPMACAATLRSSIDVQRMAKEAAVHGDVPLLKQAMLHDPLTGAICNPEEVWQLTDEMLVEQARWLPQFADEIPAARERLANGTVRTIDWAGAARKEAKSVEELRARRDGAVLDADKSGESGAAKAGTKRAG